MRRAIELRGRDDAAATIGKCQKGVVERGLTRCDCERADPALELGYSLLQDIGRRVGDPTVAKAGTSRLNKAAA